MSDTPTPCLHGDIPRHACLDGSHQCEVCGMVSDHQGTCPVFRASLSLEERAGFDAEVEVLVERLERLS